MVEIFAKALSEYHSLQLRVKQQKVECARIARMLTEEEIAQLSVLDQYNVRKLIKPKTPRIKKRPVFKDASPDTDLPWTT